MVWLRGALAAIGVCLAAIAGLALLIDREGAKARHVCKLDYDVIVVLGAPVGPDGSASPCSKHG